MKTKRLYSLFRAPAKLKFLLSLVPSLAACQIAHAAEYKLLHAFAGGAGDGREPTSESSLLPSGDTFYGMTTSGGKYTNGVIYQVNMNGSGIHVIRSFNGYAILNPNGSKQDGALPVGTPVLIGSTLYGMTQEGGSNRLGTVFQVNTDGNGFQVMHHFGGFAEADGFALYGSLIVVGTNLLGLTEDGGTNGLSTGTVFSIGADGSGYRVIHSFTPADGEGPQGSLVQSGSVLYGMTGSTIFQINPDGSGYQSLHTFMGGANDGLTARGSLVVSGPYLYGMTYSGGSNDLGAIFSFNTNTLQIQVLHSFSLSEAWGPYGDLALSGSTLYGESYTGVTNSFGGLLGSGAVFQINTSGSGYQLLHVFLFPINPTDGSLPFGTPLVLGSTLYGVTSLGCSTKYDGGGIFELLLNGGGGGPPPSAPTLSITGPAKNATVITSSIPVAGTTHGAVAVTNVVLTLNGAPLHVSTADKFVKWTAEAAGLQPGTNTIVAYAVNADGVSSAQDVVSFFYKVTAELTGDIIGRGTLTPDDIGKQLDIGQGYTMKALASPGFELSDWTLALGTNISTFTNSEISLQMQSDLVLTVTFVDIEAPTVTITTKAGSGSNAVVTIAGAAKDNVGVTAVWCQVGSSGWNLAATTDAFTNWTDVVVLNPGENTIQVYAEDAAGNRSTTNTVKLDNTSPDLAPETIAGTMLDLVTSGATTWLSFDAATFSQVASNGTDAAVGAYTYTLTAGNTALLALNFTAPPAMISSSVVNLDFASGTFSNSSSKSGFFTLHDASSTVPLSLSGLTLHGAGAGGYRFTNQYGDGTFTGSDTSGNYSGTYSFSPYSPNGGILLASLTNAADLGAADYLLLNFFAASNLYFLASINGDNVTSTNAGAFTAAGQTVTKGYTAPLSINGLVSAVTQISPNGFRISYDVSYGPANFGSFTTETSVFSLVGTYAYIRTGPKTAILQTLGSLPPDEALDTDSILTFTSKTSANFIGPFTHGTFTFLTPASHVPVSLAGRTISISGKHSSGAFAFDDGSFTGSGGLSAYSGTYTFAPYGPQEVLVVLTSGATDYLLLWFSSATTGSCRLDNGAGQVKSGPFTMK
jgi:uncharacterized repeat protein (TIGR03803 family)